MHRRLLFIIILALYFCCRAEGQEQKIKRDSIRIEKDSLRIERDSLKIERDSLNIKRDSISYKAIETYSQKSKFTRFLHRLIFKPVDAKTGQKVAKPRVRKTKPYRKAEGKIVRAIFITTLDPFGYNLQDTSIHPSTFPSRAANSLHIKTQPVIVHNLLLFKKNEPYDSLLVNESMRLIRSQKYIRDVYFYSLPTSKKADSVDIYIRVSDIWSLIPAFRLSASTMNVGLTDNNFMGMGNQLHADLQRNRYEDYNVIRISYLIPNIRRSYISLNIQNLFPGNNNMVENYQFQRSYYSPVTSNLQYLFSENKDLVRSIELKRLFYSPLTKWAGGIFLGQMILPQSYIFQDTIRFLSSKTNIQDYWGARSWQLFKGYWVNGRITSLILSGRILITRYPGRQPEAIRENIFRNENSYFSGVGITSRNYVQDKYIFNFGKIEDIPVGRAIGLTVGVNSQETTRLYMGLNVSWGNYYHFGYLTTNLEYGTFNGQKGFQQGVFTGRINYFTRLLTLGNWKIRQFVRPTLIFGMNRSPTDNLTFSEGMKGFEDLKYSATKMMVLTLQTQSYSPLDLLGFNFGPYIYTSLGMLGNETSGFSKSHLYSLFGFGVLIKNNYLTFNIFQISVTFYPYIPGRGYNIFKTNAYKTSDYGFRDFEISKPGIVNYR
jgi:hypothetical protein